MLQRVLGPSSHVETTLMRRAAGLSAIAALLHGAVIRAHMNYWVAAGVFFAIVTLAQLMFALVCTRRTSIRGWVSLWGIAGNAAVVVIYVISRTTRIPFSPRVGAHGSANVAGVPLILPRFERMGGIDVLALLVELALIITLIATLNAAHRRTATNVLCVTGGALIAGSAFGLLS
jgi:hypothetical protein